MSLHRIGYDTKEEAETAGRTFLIRGWELQVYTVYDGTWMFRVHRGPVSVYFDRSKHERREPAFWCLIAGQADETGGSGGPWRFGVADARVYFPTPKEAVHHEVELYVAYKQAEVERYKRLDAALNDLPGIHYGKKSPVIKNPRRK